MLIKLTLQILLFAVIQVLESVTDYIYKFCSYFILQLFNTSKVPRKNNNIQIVFK